MKTCTEFSEVQKNFTYQTFYKKAQISVCRLKLKFQPDVIRTCPVENLRCMLGLSRGCLLLKFCSVQ